MNLRIRYEDRYQTLTLDAKATGELWVSLGLTEEGLTQEEKEPLMQEKVEEVYNRSNYNNWHKFWRHQGDSKAQVDDEGEELESSEPLMSEVADDRIFRKDEIERDRKDSYDAVCQFIRSVLKLSNTAVLVVGNIPEGGTMRDLMWNMQDIAYFRKPPYFYNFETIDGDYFTAYPGIDKHGTFTLFGDDCSYTWSMKESAGVPVAAWEVSAENEAALDRYEGFPAFYYKKEGLVQFDTSGI